MLTSWITFVTSFIIWFLPVTKEYAWPLQDAPASHQFLAGLVSPDVELSPSNSNVAIVGDAPVQSVLPWTSYTTSLILFLSGPWFYSPKWRFCLNSRQSIWDGYLELFTIPSNSYGIMGQSRWKFVLQSSPLSRVNWILLGQLPVSIVWDPVGQTVYLTANPAGVILNHPGWQVVVCPCT